MSIAHCRVRAQFWSLRSAGLVPDIQIVVQHAKKRWDRVCCRSKTNEDKKLGEILWIWVHLDERRQTARFWLLMITWWKCLACSTRWECTRTRDDTQNEKRYKRWHTERKMIYGKKVHVQYQRPQTVGQKNFRKKEDVHYQRWETERKIVRKITHRKKDDIWKKRWHTIQKMTHRKKVHIIHIQKERWHTKRMMKLYDRWHTVRKIKHSMHWGILSPLPQNATDRKEFQHSICNNTRVEGKGTFLNCMLCPRDWLEGISCQVAQSKGQCDICCAISIYYDHQVRCEVITYDHGDHLWSSGAMRGDLLRSWRSLKIIGCDARWERESRSYEQYWTDRTTLTWTVQKRENNLRSSGAMRGGARGFSSPAWGS